MDEKKQGRPAHPLDQAGRELFDQRFNVASATECTGMMPTPPVNEAEAEAYGDIYDIPLAKDAGDARRELQQERKIPNEVNDVGEQL